MFFARPLLPREHGAYAQMAFPLLTALLLQPPHGATLLLATAAVAFFLAYEPLAVLAGSRGQGRKARSGATAAVQARVLVGSGLALGAGGLLVSDVPLWLELALPLAPALGILPLLPGGRQKTLGGEILVFSAFAALVVPLAKASGVPPARSAVAAAVWWLSFLLGTLAVHAIKTRHGKGRHPWAVWGAPAAAAVVLVGALGATLHLPTGFLPPVGGVEAGVPPFGAALAGESQGARGFEPSAGSFPPAAGLLPPALAALVFSGLGVHPRHLKKVGWSLVAANLLTLGILLLTL